MKHTIIGLDIGGTNLRIGAVNENKEIVASQIMDSDIVSKAAHPIEKLCRIIQSFIEEHQLQDVGAVSIGVASSVANDNETVICTTNMRGDDGEPIFQNTNIATYLKKQLKLPVFVNNDTSNILYYDVYRNKLEDRKLVIGIYIGTGVGAAVLIDGKQLKGVNGAALDLGHIPYYKGEDLCVCSKHGCCECYASGWKLENLLEEYYPGESIRNIFRDHADEAPLKEFVYSCSHVFSVMATIFNPDTIIYGGGVIDMKGFPIERFEEEVKKNTGLDVMNYGFDFIYSQPYTEKGIVGSAIFAEQMLNKQEA